MGDKPVATGESKVTPPQARAPEQSVMPGGESAADMLEPDAGGVLTDAWRVWSDLRQILRISIAGDLDPDTAPAPLLEHLSHLVGAQGPDWLETRVLSIQDEVRALFLQIVGPPSDGTAALGR